MLRIVPPGDFGLSPSLHLPHPAPGSPDTVSSPHACHVLRERSHVAWRARPASSRVTRLTGTCSQFPPFSDSAKRRTCQPPARPWAGGGMREGSGDGGPGGPCRARAPGDQGPGRAWSWGSGGPPCLLAHPGPKETHSQRHVMGVGAPSFDRWRLPRVWLLGAGTRDFQRDR